jgi:Tol biopolymer transport system component
MTDLDSRLRSLDAIPDLDVWDDIRTRAPRPGSPEPPRNRLLVVVVALAVALGSFIGLLEAFRGGRDRSAAGAPANGLIVFADDGPSPTKFQNIDLFAFDPASGDRVNLTNTPTVAEQTPVWSPDGTKVMFERNSPEQTDHNGILDEIVVANADLSGQSVIEECPDSCGYFDMAWSDDGAHLAWSTDRRVGDGEYATTLETYDLASATTTSICDSRSCGDPGQPAWSPDAMRIAFSDAGSYRIPGLILPAGPIWMADAGSGLFHALTQQDQPCNPQKRPCSFDSSPAWSPDGRSIAFVRETRGGDQEASTDVMIVAGDGSDLRVLHECVSNDQCRQGPLAWSPDGRSIAFFDRYDTPALNLLNPVDGTDVTMPMPSRVGENLTGLVWSPDGAPLAVLGDASGSALDVVDVSAGDVQEMPPGLSSQGGLAWLPAGALEAISRSPVHSSASEKGSEPTASTAQPLPGLVLGQDSRVDGWVTLANGFGVWVAGAGDLFQVDPRTGASHRVATGRWDYDYVGLSDYGEGTIFLTSGSTLLELDAPSGTVIHRFDLGSLGYLGDALQARSGTWVTASSQDGGEVLAQIDLDTGAVLERFGVGQGQVVEAAGYLFTASGGSDGASIVRVDPGSGDITPVPGVAGGAIAAVGSHVWVTSGAGVTCVDAVELTSCGDVPVTRPGLLAADGPRLWVLSLTGSKRWRLYIPDPDQPASVTLLDGATGETLAGPLALPDTTPASLSAFDGHAWVGFHDTGRIVRIDTCSEPCGS